MQNKTYEFISASTSNLNHDVGADVKSEFSCTSNTINDAWVPLIPPQSHQADSDRFSRYLLFTLIYLSRVVIINDYTRSFDFYVQN